VVWQRGVYDSSPPAVAITTRSKQASEPNQTETTFADDILMDQPLVGW